MPEQNDVEDTLQGLSGKPWLDRDDWYVCTVQLGGDDHVELLAVSGRITDHLEDMLDIVSQLAPSGDETDTMAVLQEALSGELPDKVWYKLDQLLTEHIRDWDLSTYAEKHGMDRPPRVPGDCDDADEREAMLRDLPVPVLGRLIYGLAWHSGNF